MLFAILKDLTPTLVQYYGALVFLWEVIALLSISVAREFGASDPQAFVTYLFSGVVLVFPIDIKLDATWRRTLPIQKKNA